MAGLCEEKRVWRRRIFHLDLHPKLTLPQFDQQSRIVNGFEKTRSKYLMNSETQTITDSMIESALCRARSTPAPVSPRGARDYGAAMRR